VASGELAAPSLIVTEKAEENHEDATPPTSICNLKYYSSVLLLPCSRITWNSKRLHAFDDDYTLVNPRSGDANTSTIYRYPAKSISCFREHSFSLASCDQFDLVVQSVV